MIRLTDDVQKQIIAFLRAGGSPEVAAQAAGVSAEQFAQWMRRGRSRHGSARYRQFAQAIEQAVAQARLGAEVAIRGERPLEWLRHGPTGGEWGRGRTGGENHPLGAPAFRDLLGVLLEALAAYPEARQAAAQVLEQRSGEETEKRSGERA
jgi:hypothetical protein